VQPRLDEAMGRRIGCSPKAQARFLGRIEGVRSPAVIEVTASHPRQYGLPTLRILVIGAPPNCGGPGIPQRAMTSSRSPSAPLRTIGAIWSGKIPGNWGRLPVRSCRARKLRCTRPRPKGLRTTVASRAFGESNNIPLLRGQGIPELG
jgi:hypothetical protein